MAELPAPLPSGLTERRGVEGGVAAVSFRRDVACYVCSCSASERRSFPGRAPDVASNVLRSPPSYKIDNMKSVVGRLLFYLTLLALSDWQLCRTRPGRSPPKHASQESRRKTSSSALRTRKPNSPRPATEYTYSQDVKVQNVDGETVKGEYHEVFDVLFDDKGKRIENVVFAPQSSLDQSGLSMDQGDFEDIRHRLPFVLHQSRTCPNTTFCTSDNSSRTSCTPSFLILRPKRLRAKSVTSRGASGSMTTTTRS